MSYNKKTIKHLIDKIADQEFVLPAIQREFVWKPEQIEKLFDSLMRGYPIGSFLFWNISPENVTSYQFYGFLSKYHSRDCRHNPKLEPSGTRAITAILDGQQRLTSLYIGLKGSYAEKRKNIKISSPNAFPEKYLYLNLIPNPVDDADDDITDMLYEFRFLTVEEKEASDNLWFKVGDILSIDPSNYLIEELDDLDKDSKRTVLKILTNLKNLIEDKEIVNYFEETEQNLDKVLNIFIRVNSQGTPLSYSDLLLTTATALWNNYDARKEIHELVDVLNNKGMNINTDFVMKSSLMLTDLNVQFSVKNFTRENMKIIESQWESIKMYLELVVSFLQMNGYNDKYIPAYNALLPIAYYFKIAEIDFDKFLTHKNYHSDRETVIKWVRRAFIKQIFGGSSDATLTTYRDVIKKNYQHGFPLKDLEARFKGKRQDIIFSDDDIKELLDDTYYNNKKRLFSVMTAIFKIPNHALEMTIDHMFPKSSFTPKNLSSWGFKSKEDQEQVLEWVNHIANLQYLEISHNKAKSANAFESWVKEQESNFRTYQLVPEMKSYAPKDFIQFCEKRYGLLLTQLKKNI